MSYNSDTINIREKITSNTLPKRKAIESQHEVSTLSINQTILNPNKTSLSEEILTSILDTIDSIDIIKLEDNNYFDANTEYLHSDIIISSEQLSTSDAIVPDENTAAKSSLLPNNCTENDKQMKEIYINVNNNNNNYENENDVDDYDRNNINMIGSSCSSSSTNRSDFSNILSINKSSLHGMISSNNYPCSTGNVDYQLTYSKTNTNLTHATSQITHGQLILEARPKGAPEKPSTEHKKHMKQYRKMIETAKKKELQHSLDIIQKSAQRENELQELHIFWTYQVLPNWSKLRKTKKVQEMWWRGIPSKVRSKVWYLCLKADMNITPELYSIFLDHARKKIEIQDLVSGDLSDTLKSQNVHALADMVKGREDSVEVIKYDISRTFPNLVIFSYNGPLYQPLHNVLGAYVCFRPDIGYVQGMSFIAAILLLNLEEFEAFVCLANLINRPILHTFFRVDSACMEVYFRAFDMLVSELFPKVFINMQRVGMKSNLYLIDWIFTMFSKPLGMDCVCRIWDIYMRDGDSFLFRTALGLIHILHDELATLEFIHMGQALSKIPEKYDFPDILFTHIAKVILTHKTFEQVLQLAEVELSTNRHFFYEENLSHEKCF